MKKKILALVLCAAMLMTTACAKKTETLEETVSVVEETTSTPEETTVVETEVEEPIVEGLYENGEEPEDYSYKVVIEINPTLILFMKLDENGGTHVSGYSYGNEDARDAYKEVCFTNLTAEAALDLAVTTAAEKNYLKENGTVSICLAPVSDIEPVPEELVDEYNKMGHVIVKNLESVNANIEAKSFDFEGKEVYLAPEVVEEEKEVVKDTKKDNEKNTTSKTTTSTKKNTSTGATNTEPANTPTTNTPATNTPVNNTPSNNTPAQTCNHRNGHYGYTRAEFVLSDTRGTLDSDVFRSDEGTVTYAVDPGTAYWICDDCGHRSLNNFSDPHPTRTIDYIWHPADVLEDFPTDEYWELYEAYYNTRFDEIYLELLEEYLSNNGIEDVSEEENDAINARAHELTQVDAAARYNRADYPTIIEEHMEERETILWNPLQYGEFLN